MGAGGGVKKCRGRCGRVLWSKCGGCGEMCLGGEKNGEGKEKCGGVKKRGGGMGECVGKCVGEMRREVWGCRKGKRRWGVKKCGGRCGRVYG